VWTIALFDDDDALAGLAPCFIHCDPEDGTRQLTLLGNGISDRLDVLVAADAPAAAGALLEHIRARSGHWNRCDFRDLPSGSCLVSDMVDGLVSDDAPCPVLDLRGADPDLAGTVSPRLLANLRNAWRRAGALGNIRIERAHSTSLPAALDALLQLHASRWAERGGDGVLSRTAVEAFHREVARGFLQRDWLRLYLLQLGSRSIAAHYGFHLRGCSYYYIGGFDPEFTKISPGALILQHAMSEAVGEGASVFDFLRGAEDYKYKWGARDRRQFRLQAACTSRS
jgi:hypothetical protein